MRSSSWLRPFICGGMVVALWGCCDLKKDDTPLPEVVTTSEHIKQFADRAAILTHLKLRGSMELSWLDADKSRQSQSFDFTLRLSQRPATTEYQVHPADLLLLGKFAGQDVAEVGVNREKLWVISRHDKPTALVGDVANFRYELPGAKTPHGIITTLQPLLLPHLLGITAPSVDGNHALQWVQDEPAVYQLFTVGLSLFADPAFYLARSVEINRRTNQVEAIRLLDHEGATVAIAKLSQYAPVTNKAGEKQATTCAYRIEISYPKQQATLLLKMDSIELTNDRPEAFATPDFAGQSLPVQPLQP